MELTFAPRGILQIDDARLIFKNFEGRGDKFTRDGDRNFCVIIPDEEVANALINDVNRDGAGWNVKIKAPREDGDSPFMYMKVKVKFNNRGPRVYLQSGDSRPIMLTEDTIGCLDNIDIQRVDLDIRPYDDVVNGRAFRAAYLESMHVVQRQDRFSSRFAEEEYPSEVPFD